MNKFDDRKKTFEKKFQIDEELKFKVEARSNKYLGQWASSKLGKSDEEEKMVAENLSESNIEESDSSAPEDDSESLEA